MNFNRYWIISIIVFLTLNIMPQKRAFTLEDIYKVKNVSSPVLSNSGQKIAFTVSDYNLSESKSNITLYVMNTNGSSLINISEKLPGAYSPFWSSDDYLYVTFNGQVYQYSLETRDTIRITNFYAGVSDPILSPDKSYIAFVAELFPECGTDSDCNKKLDEKSANGPVQAYIADELLFRHWTEYKGEKESYLILFDIRQNKYQVIAKSDVFSGSYMLGGGPKYAFSPDSRILSYVSSPEKNILVMFRSVDKPGEIYSYDINSGIFSQISFFNKKLTEEVDFRTAEQMWIDGADGIPVHVFVVKPHGFQQYMKYPLVINVHGGPQMQWMDSYRADWQIYPGSGYVVAFFNPHGSTGYGSKYTESISRDWGGKVYEDVMKVTEALSKLPYVDSTRIGAMGWSYGGYMMNWLQGNTKKFKCFVSMMGIFDLESMWGSTEELWFANWDLGGQPWNSEIYYKISPSNFVNNFSTPTLIITGERDYRVPYTQSLQYFSTLQTLGIDSRLIIFKNDGHWPNFLKSMPLYYNSHLEWFHKYLGGAPAPYDSKELVKNNVFK